MRKLIMAGLLSLSLMSCLGCILPAYSGDPVRRRVELIYTSENLRVMLDTWERMWFLDQPDHMVPYRTHGGII